MNKQLQQIKIAEAVGFLQDHHVRNCPDYPSDLNAMHEAKKILSDSQKRKWGELCVSMTNDFPQHIVLYCKNSVSGKNIFTVANLTAAQEAELFLKTLGLWEEEV